MDAPPLGWNAFVDVAAKLTKGTRIGLGLPTSDNSVSALHQHHVWLWSHIFDPATGRIDLTGAEALEAATSYGPGRAGGGFQARS